MRHEVSRLLDWLARQALPFWSTHGADVDGGGFIERVEPDGALIADVRRARLVARQIYVFRMAGELGWQGKARALVDHGLAALRTHHIGADDTAISRYHPATNTSEGDFDLYDQAFVLFGLAHGFAVTGDPDLQVQAERILARMREGWQHPLGGFAEHQPPQAPLKANPHMHLLEAALAWLDAGGGEPWRDLAAEVTELCLTRFIAPGNGALHEYYDAEWRRDASLAGEVVEPGHQAEWAWLLMRWADRSADPRIEPVARRLFAIAEVEGLNASQSRLINELEADLSPKWRWMRLWPQTERIKALVLFARYAAGDAERRSLHDRIGAATTSLLDFVDHPIAGCWWEHLDEEGKPVHEPARASSLYHIMGAAAELHDYVGLDLAQGSEGG
jgi:mannose-6-phosphate isomerase